MAAFSPPAARPLLLKLVRVAGYYGILPLAPYDAFTCQFLTIALRRGAEDERSRARPGASIPNVMRRTSGPASVIISLRRTPCARVGGGSLQVSRNVKIQRYYG